MFGALILGVARNPSLRGQLFSYAILGFAFAAYNVENCIKWLQTTKFRRPPKETITKHRIKI